MGRKCIRVASWFGGAALTGTCVLWFAGSSKAQNAASSGAPDRAVTTPMVVIGANDLGMHCMQPDFSELLILPPYNTIHATVIDRTHGSPELVTSGVTVEYAFASNTHSADKTNFWRFVQPLLGVALQPDVGLTGHGMTGTLTRTGNGDWSVTGIPIIPIDDNGRENPYPLATVTVRSGASVITQTNFVVPVSQELSCNLCHNTPGISPATDILRAHDRLHATTLEQQKPVFCAGCHADTALGAPGQPGVSAMSHAMHGAHASRVGSLGISNVCYACHPGVRTQCQRDVHLARGLNCTTCHGDMAAVGNPARRPWADEPRCGSCHTRAGFEFEQPGVLFRDSRGHGGVQCYVCHSSPHAITPATTGVDNLQAMRLQGMAGPLGSAPGSCTICHNQQPTDPFPHRRDD